MEDKRHAHFALGHAGELHIKYEVEKVVTLTPEQIGRISNMASFYLEGVSDQGPLSDKIVDLAIDYGASDFFYTYRNELEQKPIREALIKVTHTLKRF